jgi:hypothetical protein
VYVRAQQDLNLGALLATASIVPQQSPRLTKLLQAAAETCAVARIERYLAAGGLVDAFIDMPEDQYAPLLFK